MKKLAFCMAVVSTALVGCKAIDAADATLEMKKKTGEMAQTTDGMAQTTKEMQKKTDQMAHDMTLAEAKKLMSDPESTKSLAIPSDSLMAAADKFAQEIYLSELVKWLHVAFENLYYTKNIDQTQTGNPEYIARWDHDKGVIFAQLQAVAAQLPQEKVEALIQNQVFGKNGHRPGVYVDYVYQFLAMRAFFIQTFYLMDRGHLDAEQEMDNLEKANETLLRLNQLEFLVNLPFYDKLKYDAKGFKGANDLKSKNLDVTQIKMSQLWEMFWNKMGEEMPKEMRDERANSPDSREYQDLRNEVLMLQKKAEDQEVSRKIHS